MITTSTWTFKNQVSEQRFPVDHYYGGKSI